MHNDEKQAARRAPVVQETIEQRAQKLKGLQVLVGATPGVAVAIEKARSRFVEVYERAPLADDLAYASLLVDAFNSAQAEVACNPSMQPELATKPPEAAHHVGDCENEACIGCLPSMPTVTPEEFSRDIAEMLADHEIKVIE